jgi:hypothetical protein
MTRYRDAYDPQCDDGEEDLYDALSTQIRDSLPEYLREDGKPWDVFEVVILAGVEIERRRMPDTMIRTERDAARAKADQLQRERDEARAIADELGVVLAKQQQHCDCAAAEASHNEIWHALEAWADEKENR